MIEKFDIEGGTDGYGTAGRAALVSGSAYGLYKTYKDIPNMPKGGHFRQSMARHTAVGPSAMNAAINPIASNLSIDKVLRDELATQARPFSARTIHKKDLMRELKAVGGGHKGRSGGLADETMELYDMMMKEYDGNVQTWGFSSKEGGPLEMMRFQAGGKRFEVPLVQSNGQMVLGGYDQNIYTPRSSRVRTLKDSVELEGIDVSLVKKYKEEFQRFVSGELSPNDIKRVATDRAIWEETRGVKDLSKMSSKEIQKLKLEEYMVDLWGELSPEERVLEMKRISKIEGHSGGSASMFSKYVMATPDSLLAKGMPGAEGSISSYQLWRESQFIEGGGTTIKWAGDSGKGLGEFNIATITDKDAFSRAAKKAGVTVGELADEEAILSDTLSAKISNQRGSYKIDLGTDKVGREQTRFRDDILKSLGIGADATPEELAKAMSASGGQDGLNLDLNKKLRRLREREGGLGKEIDSLESWIGTQKQKGLMPKEQIRKLEAQLAGKKKGMSSVKEAISSYGTFGFDDTGKPIKLKTGDYSSLLKNVKMSKDAKGNYSMTFATESVYDFGIGSKLFTGGGGGKWTIKNKGNVSEILGWMEAEKKHGAAATRGQAMEFAKNYLDVDMISAESPIRLKDGTLAPREGMAAIMSYATDTVRGGNAGKIKQLERLGIVNGEFVGSDMTGKQMISAIQEFNPSSSMDELFGGESIAAGMAKKTRMVMSPDISSTQAGVGKLGTLSSRTAFNLEAMGLGDFLDDALGAERKVGEYSSFEQFKKLEEAKSLVADPTAARRAAGELGAEDLDRLFADDLDVRKVAMGGKDIETIGLGKEIDLGRGHGKVSDVSVFSADMMSPYSGGGKSSLDRASMDLIKSVKDNESEAMQLTKARKYKTAMNEVENAVGKTLIGGKVKGSMYGQAASSLEGMDQYATNLGKQMGLKDGMQAPVVAMSKADIQKQFGKGAVERASRGDLWGVVTREPIEGVHSSMPTNIVMAEKGGTFDLPGEMSGRVFVSGEDASKSLLRKSLFVDFDKDTLNVIAATTDQSSNAIKQFLGVGGKQSVMGEEFMASVDRMSSFDLKGRKPFDITTLLDSQISSLNASQKHLEKGSIGIFSNEFKNVHTGLREQLGSTMTREAAENFYLGEDFSHLFAENVLKAKHQSKEALESGAVLDAVSILRGSPDSIYGAMSEKARAGALQEVMDTISFGSKETADMVRNSTDEVVSRTLAEAMGYGDKLKKASRTEDVQNILAKATKQRNSYKKVVGMKNMENIIGTHKMGKKLLASGNYNMKMAERMLSKKGGAVKMMQDAAESASHFMTKGLKNVALFGILPAAGIGLMASLASKPKVMRPSVDGGSVHESEKRFSDQLGQASAPRTLNAIPEQKYSSFDVAGQASASTSMDSLQRFASATGRNSSVRVQDHRSHMDKYRIEEMMKKGY